MSKTVHSLTIQVTEEPQVGGGFRLAAKGDIHFHNPQGVAVVLLTALETAQECSESWGEPEAALIYKTVYDIIQDYATVRLGHTKSSLLYKKETRNGPQ